VKRSRGPGGLALRGVDQPARLVLTDLDVGEGCQVAEPRRGESEPHLADCEAGTIKRPLPGASMSAVQKNGGTGSRSNSNIAVALEGRHQSGSNFADERHS